MTRKSHPQHIILHLFVVLKCAETLRRISTGAAAAHHDQALKTLLIIGDSVDRYATDDWCGSQRDNGAAPELYYGQKNNTSIDKHFGGTWSSMGQYDKQFENHLVASNITAWMAWQTRVCLVKKKGVALVFIFNAKGVDTKGPWFKDDKIATSFGHKLCEVEDRSCHSHTGFLEPALKAIKDRWDLQPQAAVLASNFWDVGRLLTISEIPGDDFQVRAVPNWKEDAKGLIAAARGMLPAGAKLGWHTEVVPEQRGGDFKKRSTDTDRAKSSSVLPPGWEAGALALNNAIRDVAAEESLVLFNIRNGGLRDGLHPVPEVLVQLVDQFIDALL